jgi:DnaJ-domain-containing protein 1
VFSSAEEQFRRWRYKAVLVRRVFNEPEPVYQPPRENRQPPPRTEERQEPPPRSGADDRVTSMRQAYEILGLSPGRITLHAARTAYRALVAEYHPDKVAHLGPQLRELAARKTLELNLAMQFIEEHVTNG